MVLFFDKNLFVDFCLCQGVRLFINSDGECQNCTARMKKIAEPGHSSESDEYNTPTVYCLTSSISRQEFSSEHLANVLPKPSLICRI